MNEVVVIGGGQAGARAARTLRSEGFYGRVTLICGESHYPYERPPLSKELLAGTRDVGFAYIDPAAYYRDNDIDVRLSCHATALDRIERTVTLDTGDTLPYGQILLATGSRARPQLYAGEDLAGVQLLRTLEDSVELRRRLVPGAAVVIVGCGFVELEVAAIATVRGCSTTILHGAASTAFQALPDPIGGWLITLHKSHGVRIEQGVKVARFEPCAKNAKAVGGVRMVDGSFRPADVVVVGRDEIPNVEIAKQAGLEVVQGGLIVDEQCRTSDPRIFGAGDITFHPNRLLGRRVRLSSWKNAESQAVIAARNIMGHGMPYAEVPWFWSDQFGHNLQALGVGASWARMVTRDSPLEGSGCAISLSPEGQIDGAIAINAAREVRPLRDLMESAVVVSPDDLADGAR